MSWLRALFTRRFVAYLAVGVASVGVDLGLLVLLREGARTPVWVAATGGYWGSVLVNFTLNRRVSFRDRPAGRTAMGRFGVLLGLNWCATLLAVQSAVYLGVPYTAGKAAAIVLLALLNFTAYSRWVFAPHPDEGGAMVETGTTAPMTSARTDADRTRYSHGG